MVVLDEVIVDSELRERALPVGLEEEATFITVDGRLEQQWSLEPGGESAHEQAI